MKKRSIGRVSVAVAMSVWLMAFSCQDFIKTAAADLPVVIDIATGILQVVAAAQGHGQINPVEAAALTAWGNTAKADLALLQTLVSDYQAATDLGTKQTLLVKIDAGLATAEKNLNGILTAAFIKDKNTRDVINQAVKLAVDTLSAIQSQIPATATANTVVTARSIRPPKRTPPQAAALKAKYNAIVVPHFPEAQLAH